MPLAVIPFTNGRTWHCVRFGRWELRDRAGYLVGYAERIGPGKWRAYAAGRIVAEDCVDFDHAKTVVETELDGGTR